MPSPFPGMNPFLQQRYVWEEFHLKFISAAQDALIGDVGPNYIVKVETRLYVHEFSAAERGFLGRADVSVSHAPGMRSPVAAVAAPPSPVELRLPNVEAERYTWLEILDDRTHKVVTVVELLSPTNKKAGPDRDDYLSKRGFLLFGSVHFVEIDLRRGGTRPQSPSLPPCDSYVLLNRKEDRPRLGMWPLSLHDRLPLIPIPLSAPDADAALDLQAVLNRVYDAAQYGNYIYRDTPEPPLSTEQAAWAKQFMPASVTDGS